MSVKGIECGLRDGGGGRRAEKYTDNVEAASSTRRGTTTGARQHHHSSFRTPYIRQDCYQRHFPGRFLLLYRPLSSQQRIAPSATIQSPLFFVNKYRDSRVKQP
jgi:hypothetical protein